MSNESERSVTVVMNSYERLLFQISVRLKSICFGDISFSVENDGHVEDLKMINLHLRDRILTFWQIRLE